MMRLAETVRAWDVMGNSFDRLRKFEVALFIVLGSLGFLGGLALVIEGNFAAVALPLGEPVAASVHMWLLLIGTQGAFWAIAIAYIIKLVVGLLWRDNVANAALFARVGLPILVVLATVLALDDLSKSLFVPVDGQTPWPPPMLGGLSIGGLPIFATIGVLTAVLAVCGMFVASWRAACEAEKSSDGMLRVDDYLKLHRMLDVFLLLASLILGLGVLATAILLEAYNAGRGSGAVDTSYVIAYGGLYSVFLAISYGACRMQLHARGIRLRDALAGPAPVAGAKIKEWSDVRSALNDLLNLRLNGLSAFGESFSVAIPFVTGVISATLGGSSG